MRLHGMLGGVLMLTAIAAQARDHAGDEKNLRMVEAAVCQAFQDGDAKTLHKYLDAQFTLVNSGGELTRLQANLDEVAKREPFYDEFRNHDQTVRLYGDAAIINGVTSIKGKSEGKPFEADFEFTDTYVYRDGSWLLAASHASRIKK